MQRTGLILGFVVLATCGALAREGAAQTPPAVAGQVRWTGHHVPLEDAARNAREVLVVRLDDLGRGEPGPPGATVFTASRWTVRATLRGASAVSSTVALDLTVQTIPPEHAVQRPRVGGSYIVFLGGDSFGPTQVRKLLPDTPENRSAVERLLQRRP